jgi:hypothetical protein
MLIEFWKEAHKSRSLVTPKDKYCHHYSPQCCHSSSEKTDFDLWETYSGSVYNIRFKTNICHSPFFSSLMKVRDKITELVRCPAKEWMTKMWFPAKARIFLFTIMSRVALQPTQPPVHWVLEAFFPGLKWPKCKAYHPHLAPRLMNVLCFIFSPVPWHGMVLEHMGQLSLYTYTALIFYLCLKFMFPIHACNSSGW